MRAAVFHGPNRLDVTSLPRPTGRTVARVLACAVCGYDVRVFRNGHRKVNPPIVLGHEICAEIIDVAEDLRNKVTLGSRVVIYPQVPCQQCHYCRLEMYNTCSSLKEIGSSLNGGFAEFIDIPDSIVNIGGLVAIPDNISAEQAALLEPLACCLNSMSRMNIPRAQRTNAVVIGDGPIGLMHLLLFKLFGIQPICVVGKIEARLRVAKDLGADLVLSYAGSEHTAQQIKESFSQSGVDCVVVATSAPSALELALLLVGKNSIINLFAGMPAGQKLCLDANSFHYGQTSVTGTFGCTPSYLAKAVQLVAENQVKLDRLITKRYALPDIERALIDSERYLGLRGIVTRF